MNCLHSVPALGESGGGPPRSVSQLCNVLCRENWPTRIVTAVDSADPIVHLDACIQLITLKGRSHSLLGRLCSKGFYSALANTHKVESVSLIHQHGIWLRSSHAVITFAHRKKIPLVVAPRGMLEPWAMNYRKWKKELAWQLYQKKDLQCATAFHATAYSEAESIRRLGFKQPIAVIPNGIDLPLLKPEVSRSESSKSDIRTVLFLSRINPKKGLPMLLDGWKKVAPEGWRLIIAGNDDSNHLPVLKQKIKELELSGQVEIVGPLFGDDKEQAYLNADLFVLPSYSENFGIVVTEALSYGLPVLTTTGCPWEELETERCGWWVEPTPDGIERGLKAALKNSSLQELQDMGLRGRALVEKRYLWPAIASDMSFLYKWLLGRENQPDFVI